MTKEELFNKYEPLCTYVFAKRFPQKCYEQFKEDFIQEGRLALWVALNKDLYDEGDSKRLFNYFYSVIYHRMICFARTCNKANSVVSGSTLAVPVVTVEQIENDCSKAIVRWYMNNCTSSTYLNSVRFAVQVYDKDKNGTLSREEFEAYFKKMLHKLSEICKLRAMQLEQQG